MKKRNGEGGGKANSGKNIFPLSPPFPLPFDLSTVTLLRSEV